VDGQIALEHTHLSRSPASVRKESQVDLKKLWVDVQPALVNIHLYQQIQHFLYAGEQVEIVVWGDVQLPQANNHLSLALWVKNWGKAGMS